MELHELIAYLDKRFAENAQQIERQIDERFAANARQIDERFAENAQQIESFRAEVNGRFQQNDGRFERLEESVRHTQIQIEGMRGDIRLIAEKVGTLDDKIEGVRSELKAEIGDVKDLLVRSYRDHDSRIRALESRVKKRAPGKGRPHLE